MSVSTAAGKGAFPFLEVEEYILEQPIGDQTAFNSIDLCKIVAWRDLAPLCTTTSIRTCCLALRPLHTACSSPAPSHAGLTRRLGHHHPGRTSSSPAKALFGS